MLTNQDIADLVAFRRELHRFPEISGEEKETARRVVEFLADTKPDEVLTGLGGHGVAVIYDSGKPGPTVLIRAELDALPIEERSDAEHRSQVAGKSHMCGHEGHSTILAGVGRQFGRKRPAKGRVVLMFQPAEETGKGAAGVIADPRYAQLKPDFSFSLHNLPGTPLGHVRLKEGVVNCASRGMRILLDGRTAHASQPETGVPPTFAVASLLPELTAQLALRAKAHWGYDEAFLAAYHDELVVTPGDVAAHTVCVAVLDGQIGGFYQLRVAGETARLNDLWVEPGAIGRGYGRVLWAHAVAAARERGCRELIVQSDPHAEGFYRAMGAERVGTQASTVIPGLALPLLRLALG